mmetsp:Transcript_4266/g.7070  ORF Transcript_4266/g.7070 Transcript_4266/m.7070 type:complete len:89 (+) Transcript_4266:668-934(+)
MVSKEFLSAGSVQYCLAIRVMGSSALWSIIQRCCRSFVPSSYDDKNVCGSMDQAERCLALFDPHQPFGRFGSMPLSRVDAQKGFSAEW